MRDLGSYSSYFFEVFPVLESKEGLPPTLRAVKPESKTPKETRVPKMSQFQRSKSKGLL